MMDELTELYQDVLLEHNRQPRNFGELEGATHEAEGENPACGDQVRVMVRVGDGGTVEAVQFDGQSCAICRASASMMTEDVGGRKVDEVYGRAEEVMGGLLGGGVEVPGLDEWGELAALAGVRRFPARVKCATLAWHALVAALKGERKASTEG
jgi:nitrogen fixation protein NifU and related proteins